jgi:REP element-mobilizing transposase RayT
MRSSLARGERSMLHRRNRSRIEKLAYTWARAKRVKLYRFANVGNHLHLVLKADRREDLQQFLKVFAGLAARAVMGAKKGVRRGKFWDKTAYSKIVPGGAFRAVCAYLGKNRLEAVGFGGARLRIRADGTAIVVVGDPHAAGIDPVEAEAWIRGRPK